MRLRISDRIGLVTLVTCLLIGPTQTLAQLGASIRANCIVDYTVGNDRFHFPTERSCSFSVRYGNGTATSDRYYACSVSADSDGNCSLLVPAVLSDEGVRGFVVEEVWTAPTVITDQELLHGCVVHQDFPQAKLTEVANGSQIIAVVHRYFCPKELPHSGSELSTVQYDK